MHIKDKYNSPNIGIFTLASVTASFFYQIEVINFINKKNLKEKNNYQNYSKKDNFGLFLKCKKNLPVLLLITVVSFPCSWYKNTFYKPLPFNFSFTLLLVVIILYT